MKHQPAQKTTKKLSAPKSLRPQPLAIKFGKKSGYPLVLECPIDPAEAAEAAKNTTGIPDIETANRMVDTVSEVSRTHSANQPQSDRLKMAVNTYQDASQRMHALAPVDGIEGMTAALLVAVQDAALVALKDSTHADRYDSRASSASRADRLLSSFVKLADLRSRLQGGGTTQKVTVEHVTVTAGGQAVIGAVAGARVGGGAVPQPGSEVPHAQA